MGGRIFPNQKAAQERIIDKARRERDVLARDVGTMVDASSPLDLFDGFAGQHQAGLAAQDIE